MADWKFTPGPWIYSIDGGDRQIEAGGDVFMCNTTYYPWCPGNESDWHLIAAAPDLLAFVQSLIDDYRSEDGMDEPKTIVRHAQELVAKALGEQA